MRSWDNFSGIWLMNGGWRRREGLIRYSTPLFMGGHQYRITVSGTNEIGGCWRFVCAPEIIAEN